MWKCNRLHNKGTFNSSPAATYTGIQMYRNILIGIQQGSDCIQQLCALWNNSKVLKLWHQDEPTTDKHDMQNLKSSEQYCWDAEESSPAGRCMAWCGEHSGEFLKEDSVFMFTVKQADTWSVSNSTVTASSLTLCTATERLLYGASTD